MTFLTFVWKNIARRRLRSGLTVFAVAVSIGAVVALVGVSIGFERTFSGFYQSKGVDLIVVRSGSGQRITSTLDERLGEKIRAVRSVKFTSAGLIDVVSFEEQGMYGVVVRGLPTDQNIFNEYNVVTGRALVSGDTQVILLGSILAANLGKKVGDKVELFENESFEIIGIFESSNVFENGSMIVPLDQLQRLLDRPHHVTGFAVGLESTEDGKPIERVRREIEALAPGISALPVQEHVDTMVELRAAHAMAWLTSVLAVVIGSAGILNTMLMSVHERTKEIGILRAVGWSKRQIISMILTESLVLSLAGAIFGTIAGVGSIRLLTRLPVANGLVDGNVPIYVIGQGFLIAILIGLIGGSLSAMAAAKMQPTAALRHE
jgi:putative ABC transport system permease protein